MPPQPNNLPETVVSSNPHLQLVQVIRDLIDYRELFVAFAVRNIKIRYKQTAFGVVWVLIQPLLASGVIAIVIRQIGGMRDVSGAQALLFFLAGMVPWNTFAMAVNTSSISLEGNANMIAKVYFPRMAVPGGCIASTIVDFLIAFTMLVFVAAAIGSFTFLLFAVMWPLLLIQFIFASGLGLFLAALNAQYRDTKYAVPFLLMIGMFITVLVPLDAWGPYVQWALSFSPMTGVVEGYRAVLAGEALDMTLLGKGTLVALLTLFVGMAFFRAREAKLVDIL